MAYSVSDIIEKLILIEKDSMGVYYEISEKFKESIPAVSIIARALGREEEKHIRYYETIKENVAAYQHEEIDFYLYDKAAKLLYEYKERIHTPEISKVQDLIKYALSFEKNNMGLLIDIQGRLMDNIQYIGKMSYEIISKMIEEEREHVRELEKLIQ
jgi:predicted RNA-binding protein YlqC (UPF0109 family)